MYLSLFPKKCKSWTLTACIPQTVKKYVQGDGNKSLIRMSGCSCSPAFSVFPSSRSRIAKDRTGRSGSKAVRLTGCASAPVSTGDVTLTVNC